jgi:glycosyltransferase involved in cell wall biosynthesis/O-antigen/teichoic acid export membrane protein
MSLRVRLIETLRAPGGLVRGSIAGAAMRIFDAVFGLASITILARDLGPRGMGVYSISIALVWTIGFVHAGLPVLASREVAVASERGDFARMRGVVLFGTIAIMLSSLVLMLAIALWVRFMGARIPAGEAAAYLWAVPMIPAISLGNLYAGALRGLRNPIQGQAPVYMMRPGFFILLLGAAQILAPQWITAAHAIMLQLVAFTLAMGAAAIMMLRVTPPEARRTRSIMDIGPWLKATAPMSVTIGLQAAQSNAALLLLGAFGLQASAGVYRLGQRGGDLASFGLDTVIFVSGPELARAHAVGDQTRMRHILHRSALFSFGVAAAILIAYVIANPSLLRIVFGNGFEQAYTPLLICTAAQALSAFFGLNSTVLVMCGRERIVSVAFFLAVVIQVAASAILIPLYSANGAAGALFLSYLAWNLLLWIVARRDLGLETTVLERREKSPLSSRLVLPARKANQEKDASPAAATRPDIAIVLTSLGMGGVERVRLALARDFVARGFSVDIVVMDATGPLLSHIPEGARLVPLGIGRFRRAIGALTRYLKERDPRSLLVAMWPLTSTAVFARAFARSQTRLVISDHADWRYWAEASSPYRRALLRIFSRLTYRRADAVIAVSGGVADGIAKIANVHRSDVHVIGNPLVLETPPAGSPGPVWPPGDGPKLISVARLTAEKDHATLLRAVADLRKDIPVRVAILGEGPLRPDLTELVRQLDLQDAVTMPGIDPYPRPWLETADVYVLSSPAEGFSNAIVEALACGLPVVSTDSPSGPREILMSGRYGRLTPVGDPGALADAIRETLSGPPDRQALVERAQHFSLDVVSRQYLSLLLPEDPSI